MYNLLRDVNAAARPHHQSLPNLRKEGTRESHNNAIILLPGNIRVYRFFMRHVVDVTPKKNTEATPAVFYEEDIK